MERRLIFAQVICLQTTNRYLRRNFCNNTKSYEKNTYCKRKKEYVTHREIVKNLLVVEIIRVSITRILGT